MSPADAAAMLSALNWAGVPLDHQIAVSAALETLRSVTVGIEPMQSASNVIALPVKPRTRWTKICQLDGRDWAMSTHFGPGGAWDWIVESVMQEHGVSEDRISSVEGDEDQFDGDDLVTIDGLPVYRVCTEWR